MKKIILFMFYLLLFMPLNAEPNDLNFTGFDSFRVFEYDYRHADNWNDIVKDNSRLMVYYKTSVSNNSCFITEWYYVLLKGNKKTFLGGFNIKSGFLNGEKKHAFDISHEESDFRNKYLLGLSIMNLRSPFSLRGIALDSKGNTYTTEMLKCFTINTETMSIEERTHF